MYVLAYLCLVHGTAHWRQKWYRIDATSRVFAPTTSAANKSSMMGREKLYKKHWAAVKSEQARHHRQLGY
jgi:hypothetical protein